MHDLKHAWFFGALSGMLLPTCRLIPSAPASARSLHVPLCYCIPVPELKLHAYISVWEEKKGPILLVEIRFIMSIQGTNSIVPERVTLD